MTLPIWREGRLFEIHCPRRAGQGPDLVVILFDDLGYGDVGFTGNQIIATPHMDGWPPMAWCLKIITRRRRSVRRRAPPC